MSSVFDWQSKPSEIAKTLPTRSQVEGVQKLTQLNQQRNPANKPDRPDGAFQAVEKMSLRGKPLKRYPSIASAARDVGVSRPAIDYAIKCKTPSKGYMWRKVSSFDFPNPPEEYVVKNPYNWELFRGPREIIGQFEPDGTLVAHHDSIMMAARRMTVTYNAIATAIKRGGFSCGFFWRKINLSEAQERIAENAT